MGLPRMTPWQALVINILFQGERRSRQIQDELAFQGVKMQMPPVYRMLGRLELAGYVSGRYRQYQAMDGRTIRERHYRVSETGLQQWYETIAFYRAMLPPSDCVGRIPPDAVQGRFPWGFALPEFLNAVRGRFQFRVPCSRAA